MALWIPCTGWLGVSTMMTPLPGMFWITGQSTGCSTQTKRDPEPPQPAIINNNQRQVDTGFPPWRAGPRARKSWIAGIPIAWQKDTARWYVWTAFSTKKRIIVPHIQPKSGETTAYSASRYEAPVLFIIARSTVVVGRSTNTKQSWSTTNQQVGGPPHISKSIRELAPFLIIIRSLLQWL